MASLQPEHLAMSDPTHSRIPVPATAPNLYLVGFMGTGKSAVGSRVAQQLGMPFCDSDHWIESHEGASIPEIFASRGESGFRELERQFIEEAQPLHRSVISCGGGLITNPALLARMQQMGVVVVLYASVETLYQRIAQDPNRPLMRVADPRQRIESLLSEREEIYKQAGIGIMTDGYGLHEVADKVTRVYLSHLKTPG